MNTNLLNKLKTFTKRKLKLGWTGKLLIIFTIATFILGLIFYGNILVFWLLFDSIVKSLAANLNLDIWLARIAAIGIGVLFIKYILPLVFSFSGQKRRLGYLVIGTIFGLIFFGAYWANRDFVFNPDGTAKTCVAWNPIAGKYDDGIPCTWKVHPKYGTEVVPASKEMVAIKNNMDRGPGRFNRITPSLDLRFFSPDGTPLIWYYQRPDGKIELFGYKGSHPQLQVQLAPMNSEIAALVIKHLEEGNYDKIAADNSRPSAKDASFAAGKAVSIQDGANEAFSELTKLNDLLKSLRR